MRNEGSSLSDLSPRSIVIRKLAEHAKGLLLRQLGHPKSNPGPAAFDPLLAEGLILSGFLLNPYIINKLPLL
jgi:hypothetical protein